MLPGADAGDGVIWQRHGRQTFPVPHRPVFREAESPVDETMLPSIGRQIIGVRREKVQVKSRRRIRRITNFPAVNQTPAVQIQLEIPGGGRGAQTGQPGLDFLEPRKDRRVQAPPATAFPRPPAAARC